MFDWLFFCGLVLLLFVGIVVFCWFIVVGVVFLSPWKTDLHGRRVSFFSAPAQTFNLVFSPSTALKFLAQRSIILSF